jgi:hypothetical protein
MTALCDSNAEKPKFLFSGSPCRAARYPGTPCRVKKTLAHMEGKFASLLALDVTE